MARFWFQFLKKIFAKDLTGRSILRINLSNLQTDEMTGEFQPFLDLLTIFFWSVYYCFHQLIVLEDKFVVSPPNYLHWLSDFNHICPSEMHVIKNIWAYPKFCIVMPLRAGMWPKNNFGIFSVVKLWFILAFGYCQSSFGFETIWIEYETCFLKKSKKLILFRKIILFEFLKISQTS